MLVLTRKVNDVIRLKVPPSTEETEIEVKIVRLMKTGARVGVEAPADVRILRGELPTETEATTEESPSPA